MSRNSDFWSRRKAGVEAETEAERAAVLADEQAQVLAEHEAKPDEELLAELDLPDPDTLEQGDDFSVFMAKAVPDRLRRRALRRLWLSNPVLANVDGLVDYGEDFTDAATVIENLQTAYQVGKGMTAHVEEMARQAALEEAAEDEDEAETLPEAEEPSEELLAENETISEAPEVADEIALAAEADIQGPDEGIPPRRRMHFTFQGQSGEMA